MTEPPVKLNAAQLTDWKARKNGQAVKFMKLDKDLRLETTDNGTTFLLTRTGDHRAYLLGRLAKGNKRGIDATDTQAERWVKGTMRVVLP